MACCLLADVATMESEHHRIRGSDSERKPDNRVHHVDGRTASGAGRGTLHLGRHEPGRQRYQRKPQHPSQPHPAVYFLRQSRRPSGKCPRAHGAVEGAGYCLHWTRGLLWDRGEGGRLLEPTHGVLRKAYSPNLSAYASVCLPVKSLSIFSYISCLCILVLVWSITYLILSACPGFGLNLTTAKETALLPVGQLYIYIHVVFFFSISPHWSHKTRRLIIDTLVSRCRNFR